MVIQHWRLTRHQLVAVPSLESARYVAEMEAAVADLSQEAEPNLIHRTDTRQKHDSRAELRRWVTQQGLGVLTLRRIHYPWSEEGLEHSASKPLWDWVCLAGKAE